MMKTMRRAALWLTMICGLATAPANAASEALDTTPRTAIISAFAPEWASLIGLIEQPVQREINGVAIVTGTMAGKPVVLMESGVSMVNAAMNAQMLIDRFTVSRIVFSGIAGGADPALAVGDVAVPASWSQNLEVVMARETASGFLLPPGAQASKRAPFGMMFPRGIRMGSDPTRHEAFAADAALVALATRIAQAVTLKRCIEAPATRCLPGTPRIVVGGTGVSSPAFVDNAAYRSYLHKSYDARVIDMETAAVAQVAHANRIPFIGFRSLSDLAGGDAGPNSMTIFMSLAAENSASVVRAFIAALPSETQETR